MTLTNNTEWNITCSGSEPSGYNSIGGAPVDRLIKASRICLQYRSSTGDFTVFMGEQDGIDFDSLLCLINSTPLFWGRYFNSKQKTHYLFWRIPDTSGLPPPPVLPE